MKVGRDDLTNNAEAKVGGFIVLHSTEPWLQRDKGTTPQKEIRFRMIERSFVSWVTEIRIRIPSCDKDVTRMRVSFCQSRNRGHLVFDIRRERAKCGILFSFVFDCACSLRSRFHSDMLELLKI